MCATTNFRTALKYILEDSHPQITYTFEKRPFKKTGRRHNTLCYDVLNRQEDKRESMFTQNVEYH